MTDISNFARSKVGSVRERELYRYYQPKSRNESDARQRNLTVLPDNESVTADGVTSPDNTLTALAQLAAIRLNAQRAMVRYISVTVERIMGLMSCSVLDNEYQYFLAESTKSLDIADSKKCEVNGDGLWIGCSRVRKEGRLCEVCLQSCISYGKNR